MVTCKHYTLYYYDGIINELEISKRVRILCMDLWANRKKKKKNTNLLKKKKKPETRFGPYGIGLVGQTARRE